MHIISWKKLYKNTKSLQRKLLSTRSNISLLHFAKLNYYVKNILHKYLYPKFLKQHKKKYLYKLLSDKNLKKSIFDRVNYYCGLENYFTLQQDFKNENQAPFNIYKVDKTDIFQIDSPSVYILDIYYYASYFYNKLKLQVLPGDVNIAPKVECIVKTRPISSNKGIILNLDKVRHFNNPFVKDKIKFNDKISKLVWRGAAFQQHRLNFLKQYHGHKLMDAAQAHDSSQEFFGKYLSRQEQFAYKYILSIEGNDVATNLKWVLSSNSLCFMTKPKYESWFMEGKLKDGIHYVQLKDDYSDIVTKIEYFNNNPQEAEAIIKNAHEHCKQFFDKNHEDLIHLLVLEKFFHLSKQIESKFYAN